MIIGKKRLDKLALLFEMVYQNLNIWLIGEGKNKIHFIYSLDLITAIEKSLLLKGKYLFNIGSENVKSIYDVFNQLLEKSGSNKKIRKFPKILVFIFLKFLNIINLVSLGPYHQRMLVSNCVLDTNKIKKTLNWKPKYTNEEMLIECYNNYIKTRNDKKERSSSKKLPNLKVIKLLKIFNF